MVLTYTECWSFNSLSANIENACEYLLTLTSQSPF